LHLLFSDADDLKGQKVLIFVAVVGLVARVREEVGNVQPKVTEN
jgi:hypothetical protein